VLGVVVNRHQHGRHARNGYYRSYYRYQYDHGYRGYVGNYLDHRDGDESDPSVTKQISSATAADDKEGSDKSSGNDSVCAALLRHIDVGLACASS